MSGAGFGSFEPVLVYFSVGPTAECLGIQGASAGTISGTVEAGWSACNPGFPALSTGPIDSNGGGAWTMSVDLGSLGSINNWKSTMLTNGVVSVIAEGADGSRATAPAFVLGEAPPPPPPPPPAQGLPPIATSISSSLTGGTVVQGGAITVWGGGFCGNEIVKFLAVTGTTDDGLPQRRALATGKAGPGGAFTQDVTFPENNFDPGFYTLEAVGVVCGYGSAAIQVVSAAK